MHHQAVWVNCSYGLTWEGSQTRSALGDYYLDLGDKLSVLCPSCILLIEGTGQSKFLGVDWCALGHGPWGRVPSLYYGHICMPDCCTRAVWRTLWNVFQPATIRST